MTETAAQDRRPRIGRLGFGIANVFVAVLVLVCVFRFLPARWWPVDGGALVLAGLYGSSGVTLLADRAVATRLTRIAAGLGLALGLVLFAALVLTAMWLKGVYAQTGVTGAALFGLVALLVLPYLVVFPAAQLLWIGKRA